MKKTLICLLLWLALIPTALGDCLCDPTMLLPEGDEPVWTDSSYQSENVCISITSERYLNTDIHVADIYVRSIDSFQRGMASGKWKGATQRIDKIAKANEGIIAMTGDNSANLSVGWVIANGKICRKTSNRKRELCLLYSSGEMVILEPGDIVAADIAAGVESGEIWQSFLFGPGLLTADGKAKTTFNSDVKPKNPRSVIGYYEPGHYCFVQVDGRQSASKLEKGKKNAGLTLAELSAYMETLGCASAYNLDGGQSSLMYFQNGIYSSPYKNGRRLGDVVLIREPEAE